MNQFYLVLFVLIGIVGCSSKKTTPSTHDPPIIILEEPTVTEWEEPEIETMVDDHNIDVINQVRIQGRVCGNRYFPPAPPLVWSDTLQEVAYAHSYDMAQTNNLQHMGSGTEFDQVGQALGKRSTMKDRITYFGYAWHYIAENIGAGTYLGEIEPMMKKWLGSVTHCSNIMNPNFTEVGWARVENSDSHYIYYWTQEFGKPRE